MSTFTGVFGGTFNPVHIGHTKVISHITKVLPFDKILVIPNSIPPHKDKIPASFEHRLNMVSLAFEGFKSVEIDAREGEREGPSYAINSIEELLSENHGELFLIVGSDSFHDISSWHRSENILNQVGLVVMNRAGYEIENEQHGEDLKKRNISQAFLLNQKRSKKIIKVNTPLVGVSSTLIRNNIYNRKKIKSFVSQPVEKYLIKHKLYEQEDLT
ncbi:MAG: nicotinate (nicotinamide) nucleotide adenylyltransferase [Gammaproteobacteria bacterium]